MQPFTPRFGWALALVGVGILAGCAAPDAVTRSDGQAIGPLTRPAVVSAETGTCFARDTTPALFETVTEQIMVQPAIVRSDGSVEQPAAFRTVTRQRILRERREVEFEVPCDSVLTPPFVASVQRALLARGYYQGGITGRMDPATADAVKRFQSAQDDVPIGTLTLRSARALGLVAMPADTL